MVHFLQATSPVRFSGDRALRPDGRQLLGESNPLVGYVSQLLPFSREEMIFRLTMGKLNLKMVLIKLILLLI